jgi:hypothetical protein
MFNSLSVLPQTAIGDRGNNGPDKPTASSHPAYAV